MKFDFNLYMLFQNSLFCKPEIGFEACQRCDSITTYIFVFAIMTNILNGIYPGSCF